MTRFSRRMLTLFSGFLICGFGIAAMVKAQLGLGPWDIFHQGLHFSLGISQGTATVLAGAGVMLLWIPMRIKPGVGTILNLLLIGPATDLALYVLPDPTGLPARIFMLGIGLPLMALGTAMYLCAAMGAGPRDGLMIALTRKFGLSIRMARTSIECSAFLGGWLMGGILGIGSFYFAFLIGPCVQFMIEYMQKSGFWFGSIISKPAHKTP